MGLTFFKRLFRVFNLLSASFCARQCMQLAECGCAARNMEFELCLHHVLGVYTSAVDRKFITKVSGLRYEAPTYAWHKGSPLLLDTDAKAYFQGGLEMLMLISRGAWVV